MASKPLQIVLDFKLAKVMMQKTAISLTYWFLALSREKKGLNKDDRTAEEKVFNGY